MLQSHLPRQRLADVWIPVTLGRERWAQLQTTMDFAGGWLMCGLRNQTLYREPGSTRSGESWIFTSVEFALKKNPTFEIAEKREE